MTGMSMTVPEAAVAGDAAPPDCAALLHHDFASFAARAFRELNPRTPFLMNWHIELIAAKLAAVRAGRIRRLIISLPPRHLKSHLATRRSPNSRRRPRARASPPRSAVC